MEGRLPEVICIFGIRGSGKTYRLREMLPEHDRVIVCDFLGQVDNAVIIEDFDALKEYLSQDNLEKFKVSYRPVYDTIDFPFVCLMAKAIGLQHKVVDSRGQVLQSVVLAIDEVDRYCGPNFEPPEFTEIIARGRHYGISIFCTSRRPAEISKLLTSQAARFICFTTHEVRDLQYLAGHIGEKAGGLSSLPFYQAVEHDFTETQKTLDKGVDDDTLD